MYLTRDDIEKIEAYVSENPILANPNMFNITTHYYDVVKVSPVSRIIIVKGNEHTGFDHIHKRHEYWSRQPYWVDAVNKDGTPYKKLQNQSRFKPESIPFWDYTKIADAIYKPENLNILKNKEPVLFDLYMGPFTNADGTKDIYKLILYKGSKVVHTMFMQRDKYNRERLKGFNFARGRVSGKRTYGKPLFEVTIEYINHEGQVRYSLHVIKNLATRKEKLVIFIHHGKYNGRFVELGIRDFIDFPDEPVELLRWEHADLRNIEDHIMGIDEYIQKEERHND